MCLSMPLYSLWGLPYTVLTFVGNIVFVPFMTIFLMFASVLMFAKLLRITVLVWISAAGVNACSALWCFVLRTFAYNISIAFPYMPLWMYGLYTLITIAIIRWPRIVNRWHRLAFAFLVWVVFIAYAHCSVSYGILPIEGERNMFSLHTSDDRVYLCCASPRPWKRSWDQWFTFTGRAHLTKVYGKTKFDGIICHNNNDAVERLCLALNKKQGLQRDWRVIASCR